MLRLERESTFTNASNQKKETIMSLNPNSPAVVLAVALASAALFAASGTADAKGKGGKAALSSGQSRTFDFGKNVTPRYARESVRPDGKTSVVYGNNLKPNGRIGKPHGHTVTPPGSGTPEYSRTRNGHETRK